MFIFFSIHQAYTRQPFHPVGLHFLITLVTDYQNNSIIHSILVLL